MVLEPSLPLIVKSPSVPLFCKVRLTPSSVRVAVAEELVSVRVNTGVPSDILILPPPIVPAKVIFPLVELLSILKTLAAVPPKVLSKYKSALESNLKL